MLGVQTSSVSTFEKTWRSVVDVFRFFGATFV